MDNKIKFECTKCGDCCFAMGPVPIVLEDIKNWVDNKVIPNMMPYIRVLQLEKQPPNLYLYTQADPNPENFTKDEKIDTEAKCLFFNSKENTCQLNIKEDYRPLYCKAYPLEFDGKGFNLIDSDCPGLKTENENEELTKQMMRDAKRFYLRRQEQNDSMPALLNAFQPFIIKHIIKMQEEMMKNMSPEDWKK